VIDTNYHSICVSSSQKDGPLKNIRVDNTVTETRVTVANIAEMFVHHSWA